MKGTFGLLGLGLWATKTRPVSITIKLGDKKVLVANYAVTEFFSSHHTFLDLGHVIDGGLTSTIYLAMKFDLVMEFGLPSNKM